jgi:hypothetical protein
MTKANPNEKDVKAGVKKILDEHGWFWWCPPANGFGQTGVSDFNALKDGVFMAIETKFGTRKPTVQQKAFLASIAAMDGFAYIVTDRNIDSFKRLMVAYDKAVAAASKNTTPDDVTGAEMINCIAALTQGY